jgi:hypothetical protein
MLNIVSGPSYLSARRLASTASATYVKSRVCRPSPYTSIGAPANEAFMKRLKAISGLCRGP